MRKNYKTMASIEGGLT